MRTTWFVPDAQEFALAEGAMKVFGDDAAGLQVYYFASAPATIIISRKTDPIPGKQVFGLPGLISPNFFAAIEKVIGLILQSPEGLLALTDLIIQILGFCLVVDQAKSMTIDWSKFFVQKEKMAYQPPPLTLENLKNGGISSISLWARAREHLKAKAIRPASGAEEPRKRK